MDSLSRKTTILGAGLLGGSLGMALRRFGLADTVDVWSPGPATRRACAEAHWCDRVHDSPGEACRGADLVVLCGPVDTSPALLSEIAPFCGGDCLVTDVGSTKGAVCRAAAAIFPASHPACFIGSHPMAGSEKSGLAHATPTLFSGGICIVTPTEGSPAEAVGRIGAVWSALGMSLRTCPPDEHDRIVAHTSHLPHFLAATLANALAGSPPEWAECSGPGLRDTTRIAAGDPALWTAIFRSNEAALRESIHDFEKALHGMKQALDQPDDREIGLFLRTAREFRLRLKENDGARDPSA
ncbi:MAG: prephenate dehydrogenase [Puniceicoccaceae bacterium]